MTRKEAAVKLRAEYKAEGWNARMISVKGQPGTYSGSIIVTIKDLSIPYKKAKEMAEGYQRISRCEASGEILAGGNLYISLYESEERKKALAEPFLDAIRKAVEELGDSDNRIVSINEEIGISNKNFNHNIMLWIGSTATGRYHSKNESGFQAAALEIARHNS